MVEIERGELGERERESVISRKSVRGKERKKERNKGESEQNIWEEGGNERDLENRI